MDSPQSDDERSQQADAGKDLVSKKLKLLIIMLSLVIIILLLPLASDHGLRPLLKPMEVSVLQRLWDAMRFIAMTAAISVGIISTSSHRDEGGSNRPAHLRSHRLPTDSIASSSREPNISPNMMDSFDTTRSSSPDLSVDRGGNGSLHQRSGDAEIGSLRKYKGKGLVDDLSTTPCKSGDGFPAGHSNSDTFPSAISREEKSYGLERNPANQVRSRSTPSPEESFESLKPRPTSARRRLSASDEWFLALRLDEKIEEEGSSARAMSGMSVGQSQRKPTSIHGGKEIKSADKAGAYANIVTDDNFAELRRRKAAMSRLPDEIEGANGSCHHRRSSSVDRRRPVHYEDQGPDRPGLKQILTDVSKERASMGAHKLSNSSPNVINEQVDRPHSAYASVSSNPNPPSTPASRQAATRTWQSDPGRMSKHASQILQKESDTEHSSLARRNDYLAANDTNQNQDQAMKDHNKRMHEENRRSHLMPQKPDDYQAMASSAQLKQKEDDLQQSSRLGSNQNVDKQADTKMPIVQRLHIADARMGPHRDDLQTSLHKPNMSSARSKLILQSSKHSRSEVHIEKLEERVDTVCVRPPTAGAKTYERRKSFSYDFGDGFNPDLLWKLEPPPPPGFMDEQSARTCPKREADQWSFLLATTPNEASAKRVEELVPWRMSAPIDISAYPPRTPSPMDPLLQGTGPSTSEVNRRADEFISKFNSNLLKQRQESMERRKQHK